MSRCKMVSESGERCIKPRSHNGVIHRDRQNNRWNDDGVVFDEEKPLNVM